RSRAFRDHLLPSLCFLCLSALGVFLLFSVVLTVRILFFREDFHRFPFAPELSLCSRLFSGFDFVFAFDFVFSPIFLRGSASPCLRGEYWVWVVAWPRRVAVSPWKSFGYNSTIHPS